MYTHPLGPVDASACAIPPSWFDRETKAEFCVSLSDKWKEKNLEILCVVDFSSQNESTNYGW